jgi:adenylate kinase
MLNIVLFGPPGAGKGTQATQLLEKYKLVHLSTGDILRAELAAGSPLGTEARKYMDKGELVPDAVVIGMIEERINQNTAARGFIFDGFPRTKAQAVAFDTLLSGRQIPVTAMLALEVEEKELIERLKGRGQVSGRADDQDMSVIQNRITVYHKETAPVIAHYDAQGKFRSINGMGTISEIFNRLCMVIDSLQGTRGCGCGCR